MISAWVAAFSCIVAGLGVGVYFDHENKKAYNKGFHDAMATKIIEIQKENGGYGVTWEEDHHD